MQIDKLNFSQKLFVFFLACFHLVFFLQPHTLHVFFVGYLLTGKCFSGRRTASMFEGRPTVFSSGFSRSLLALSRGWTISCMRTSLKYRWDLLDFCWGFKILKMMQAFQTLIQNDKKHFNNVVEYFFPPWIEQLLRSWSQ